MTILSAADGVDDEAPAPAVNRIFRAPVGGRMSDRVYEELSSAIRELRLAPGVPLSENELAEQLGVSRTPVRDAISRLVEQRLVVVIPQVGTSVALISVDAVAEVSFMRSAVESAAFARAAADPNRQVTALRAVLAAQADAIAREDGEGFFSTDEDLHSEIFRLAGVPGVWDVVRRSKVQLDRLRRLVLPEAISTHALLDEHARLVDLLEAGDVTAGVELVHEHANHVLVRAPAVREQYPAYFT